MALGGLAGQARQFGSLVGDGGGDSAPVEPVGTFHDCVEIEIGGIGLGDGASGTVVDYFRRTHRCTGLTVVDAHTVASAGNETGVDAVAAQSVYGSLADFMGREFCHEAGLMAVVGAAYGHIGFAAAPYHIEIVDLHEARVAGRRKAKHDFAEGYDFAHILIIPEFVFRLNFSRSLRTGCG